MSPAPASLPWALPISLAFFSPVCKDLEMGDLPSVPPPPPLPGSHWTPPSPAWGEWGWAVAVYPPVPLLYPNCEAFGMGRGGERAFIDLSWGGWMVSGPPRLWELPGLLGLGDASKLPQKLVAKCRSLILGVGGVQVAPESPCPMALAWGGCWITAPALGVSQGDFAAFSGTNVPLCRCPLGATCLPPPHPKLPSPPSRFVHQMFHLKK